MGTRYRPHEVASFDGGIVYTGNSRQLADNQWTDADGWLARKGYVEVLPAWEKRVDASQFNFEADQPGPWSCVGIVQNPLGTGVDGGGRLIGPDPILGFVNWNTGAVRVFGVQPNPALLNTYPWNGTDTDGGTIAPTGDRRAIMQLAFLNQTFFLNFGFGLIPIGEGSSVIRFTPGNLLGDFSTLMPTGFTLAGRSLVGNFLSSFAGHLILSYIDQTHQGWRRVLVSDQGDELVWLVDVGNSADDFNIESASGITGQLVLSPSQLALFTREAVYVMTPTGGFPPFSLDLVARPGAADQRPAGFADLARVFQQCAIGPGGALYRGFNNIYLLGRGAVGDVVADYIRKNDEARGVDDVGDQDDPATCGICSPFVYDEMREVYWCGVPRRDLERYELLAYNPQTGAWSRRTLPRARRFTRMGFVFSDDSTTPSDRLWGRLWMAEAGNDIYAESLLLTCDDSNHVDSKDFAQGDPPRRMQLGRIKVDWEGLDTGAELFVFAWAREVLGPSPGNLSGQPTMPDNSGLTLLGTLTDGASELPLRLFGKYVRFRFVAAQKRCRLRSFTFYWRYVDNRIT